uniref:Multifunctional fusion protein n=1 Tax=Melanthalia intermedia TaxID=172989 RepID=A0A345UAQ8_9FLOR|nr:translation elongation factor Ts [Melanthalia intermedia]AXI97544.1 translation elongation factor Ts [Melanthalia intermedia]
MNTQISASSVKELRTKTGAGMMDCKKALQVANGDMNIAIQVLRKKGLASAEKKSERPATDGVIESYIHTGSKIGALVELNCETDFVARRSEFRKLAKDIAMQIAASQSIIYVSINDIPQDVIDIETSIESSKDDILSKPENIRSQIINGQVDKRLRDMTLVNQPFIRDPSISVDDLIKQHIVLLGENIRIRRFQRFLLGQDLLLKQ